MVDPFLGEIRLFAGDYAPQGWALCDGTMLPISQHEALFSLIGATWGGDGKTDFALPDLRGRVAVGSGVGRGLTARALAQIGGAENVAVTVETLPSHSHAFNVTNNPATALNPVSKLLAVPSTSGTTRGLYLKQNLAGSTIQVMDPNMLDFAGGESRDKPDAEPHPNTMPSIAINHIIAILGSFPPLTPTR